MADPLTIAGAGMAVLGSKDVITKLLGPTADYIGEEVAGLVKKCNINIDEIFVRAKKKLGSRIDKDGAVSPRVLKHVLDDGRFCDDEIAAEYYGGILASSRDSVGKNDLGLHYLSKVRQMSSLQLRLHFVFYYQLLMLHKDSGLDIGLGNNLRALGLFIPSNVFTSVVPADLAETQVDLISHCSVGLRSLDLINTYSYGDPSHLEKVFPKATSAGIYLEPNFAGAELFLWGLGLENPNGHRFFTTNPVEVEEIVKVPTALVAR